MLLMDFENHFNYSTSIKLFKIAQLDQNNSMAVCTFLLISQYKTQK